MAWAWWRGDPVPRLESIPGLTVKVALPNNALAALNQVGVTEVQRRVAADNRPYVAYFDGQAVAYGWVAAGSAEFADRRCEFEVPSSARYLWDFATVPAWRGRGIYPRLLQAILTAEQAAAERFWILHAWENEASKRGIARAGFQAAAIIYEWQDGSLGIAAFEGSDRAEACAALLGLPLVAIP
jgi:GNAT superfamily N-acetyltransferase